MRKKFQQIGLIAFGAALGIAASLHFSAVADRQVSALLRPEDYGGLRPTLLTHALSIASQWVVP